MTVKDLLDRIAIDLCPDPNAEVFISGGDGELHEIFSLKLDKGDVVFN